MRLTRRMFSPVAMVLFLIDLFAGAACRPTRNVRATWLSQLWREISGGFAAKLTLSSRFVAWGRFLGPESFTG